MFTHKYNAFLQSMFRAFYFFINKRCFFAGINYLYAWGV